MYIIAVIQKGQKVATKRKPPEHFAERCEVSDVS